MFEVQYREASSEIYLPLAANTSQTSITSYFMKVGETYFLRLRAINAKGFVSEWTQVSIATNNKASKQKKKKKKPYFFIQENSIYVVGIPSKPLNFTAASVSHKKTACLVVSWLPPVHNGG